MRDNEFYSSWYNGNQNTNWWLNEHVLIGFRKSHRNHKQSHSDHSNIHYIYPYFENNLIRLTIHDWSMLWSDALDFLNGFTHSSRRAAEARRHAWHAREPRARVRSADGESVSNRVLRASSLLGAVPTERRSRWKHSHRRNVPAFASQVERPVSRWALY